MEAELEIMAEEVATAAEEARAVDAVLAAATGGGGGRRDESGEGVLPGVAVAAACSGSMPSVRSGTSSSDQSLKAVSSFFSESSSRPSLSVEMSSSSS